MHTRKRTVKIARPMWECDIKIDLKEIRWCGMDWIRVTQDRDQWRAVVSTVMNLQVP
jgi:hypothetical protein